MFPRRGQSSSEDPNVVPVEEILEAAATRSVGEPPRRDGRLVVTHAVWLCACETTDESTIRLIYAVGEDGIGWQRIPVGMDVSDVVEAEHLTGGHPAPESVLAWLRRDWLDPWRGRGIFPQDSFVYPEVRRRVHSN